jgi:hypothetical protein
MFRGEGLQDFEVLLVIFSTRLGFFHRGGDNAAEPSGCDLLRRALLGAGGMLLLDVAQQWKRSSLPG